MFRALSTVTAVTLLLGCVDPPSFRTDGEEPTVVAQEGEEDPCVPRDALPDPFVLIFDKETRELVTSGALGIEDLSDVCGFVKKHREATLPPVLWEAEHGLAFLRDKIEKACAIWRPLGVTCIEATGDQVADVVFRAEGEACEPSEVENGGGGVCVLGMAHEDGSVDLCLARMAKDTVDGDAYDEFVAVVAHELGHQLGVRHVPDDCGDVMETPVHGYIACGSALMNPCGTDVVSLTFADLIAFATRDRRRSVVKSVPDAGAPPQRE